MAHHKNTASALAREPDARYLQPAPIAGTLVDSSVLIDVLADDSLWADWSIAQLERCAQQGPLFINPLILAEVSPRFERAADLEAALADLPLVREALPWDAAFLAGQAFKVYRQSQGCDNTPPVDVAAYYHLAISPPTAPN